MRFSVVSKLVFVAGLATGGCGGRSSLDGAAASGGQGSADPMSSAAGTLAMPAPSGSGASDNGGRSAGFSGAEVGGTTSVAGSGVGGTTSASGSGVGGSVGMSGAAAGGASSGAGGGGPFDITRVAATPGCGLAPAQEPGQTVRGTLQTMGIKAPDCADKLRDGTPVCGPWSYVREYFVTLPLGYQSNKPYPLVFQGPGCGGADGSMVYPLNDPYPNGPPNVGNTVIRVGLTPPPNDVGHPTNPQMDCFDESEGDDSVEWPFYEQLYDQLAKQVCFDKNRVFSNGSGDGGGRFVDELACKYAGDAKRPIRGVISNDGDWSTNPQYLPTCTTKPMAGMWVHQALDPFRVWSSDKLAIARAMMVDHCTIGTGYDDAKLEDFPIGGGNPDTTCKRIKGCPELTPLVVCLLPGSDHKTNDSIVNPGASTFIKLFESPPLLIP